MPDSPPSISRLAQWLGLAGLLPQMAAVLATLVEPWRFIALAAGFLYAGLILSFTGGLWWGIAASRREAPDWLFGAAVVPSLLAFASGIPWMTGGTWPGPSLALLGAGLFAAPFVDRTLFRLGLIDATLLRLRERLSYALGALTIVLAFAA